MFDLSFNIISFIACTIFTFFGCIGNMFSFLIFRRAGRYKPRIMSNELLIYFSLSNIIFLSLYWYENSYPSLIKYFEMINTKKDDDDDNNNNNEFNNSTKRWKTLNNTYEPICRIVVYILNVTLCFNSLVIVFFSVERALAIRMPIRIREYRASYERAFKIVSLIIGLMAIIFPIYNLKLIKIIEVNMIPNSNVTETYCDVVEDDRLLYYKMTIVLFIITVAVPFTIITIANIVILLKLYSDASEREANSSLIPVHYSQHIGKANSKYYNNEESVTVNAIRIKRKKDTSLNRRLTKTLVAISVSFLILNFPYFVAWSVYATKLMSNSGDSFQYYNYVKYTEILNLFSQSFTCLLYFASGENYRHHFMVLLGYKSSSQTIRH
jgi:hypothetical protein